MSAVTPEITSVASVDEIVDAVQSAVRDAVTISAGRQSAAARRVDLSAMNQVVDYPARDMTITVQAGMSVGALQEILLGENQQLPVDCADPEMSVGAFVASNIAASRQYSYGTLRDYLIGIEAVDGQGRVFHAGGRVVKNVAGYDLCRLMIGSWGRLAILSQLTFKLKPRSPHEVIARFAFANPDEAASALERLNTSVTRPVLIDLRTAPGEPWGIAVGFAGTTRSCAWELDRVREELSSGKESQTPLAGHAACAAWCVEAARAHLPQSGRILVRTLPSRVVEVARLLLECSSSVIAHAGNGILLAGPLESSMADIRTDAVTQYIADCGGSICRPGEGPAALSDPEQRIVASFDPHNIFDTSEQTFHS